MDNLDVARALLEIADLLEFRGDEPFKVRAYRKAAQALELLPEPVTAVAERGALTKVPGIGKAIAAKVEELLATGRIEYLEELRRAVPPGVLELTAVPGLGARTAYLLYTRLGIDSLDRLEMAARHGELRALPGMGPRKEDAILQGLEKLRTLRREIPLGAVQPVADGLSEILRRHPAVQAAEAAGAVRRRSDTVTGLELVVATSDPDGVVEYLLGLGIGARAEADRPSQATGEGTVGGARAAASGPGVSGVRTVGSAVASGSAASAGATSNPGAASTGGAASSSGGTSPRGGAQRASSLRTDSGAHLEARRVALTTTLGLKITIHLVPPDRFALALLLLTGSAAHLQVLGPLTPAATEEAIYAQLGLPFIPPELREGRGEVEAARTGRLPRLIEISDIRGDLHTHTRASDGTATALEMAQAARRLGYRYLAICDHSQSLAVAGGLTPERLRMQRAEIRRLNEDLGDFRLLHGTEVDILKDGSLDFRDDVLAELDIVVASIHSHMGLDETAQTERLLKAIYNPHVDIIGHPTGRVLGRRTPYPVDFARILSACRETGTALEINASPSRLDLNDELARMAIEAGVKLVINTDAHAIPELELMPYGVGQARRAWAEAGNVVNTMDLDDLLAWLAEPKGRLGPS